MILLTITEKTNQTAQFLTVVILFLVVIGITWVTTRWISNYQKGQNDHTGNVELIEAARLGSNKYVQIVRIGDKYLALAICKDTVTVLCEVPKDELKEVVKTDTVGSFKDYFATFLNNNNKNIKFDEKQDSEEK